MLALVELAEERLEFRTERIACGDDTERRAAVHAAIGLLNSTGYRRQVGLPRSQAEDLLARMALVALLDK